MAKKDHSNPNNLEIEKKLWSEGKKYIAGCDEVGRGCFAGPVVAAAVVMPKDLRIDRLTDSKKIPKSEHEKFVSEVKAKALGWAIGEASVEEIDRLNIKKASQLAMKRAVENLKMVSVDYILVDGREMVDLPIEQESVIKGDFHSHTISAAAIIAKLHRDKKLAMLDESFDHVYNWKKNAGYQTKEHIEACHKYGLTKYHRKSWKTVELFK